MGGIAGALLATITLWRTVTEEQPLRKEVEIKAVQRIENNFSRHNYCRMYIKKGGDQKTCFEQPDATGNLFAVKTWIQGYKGACCRLTWSLREVDNLQSAINHYDSVIATDRIQPESTAGVVDTWNVWVPNPSWSGRFKLRAELWVGDQRRDLRWSPPFTVVKV